MAKPQTTSATMRTIQANPTSVSSTIISMCGRSSVRSDSPLMALAIVTMLTTDSNTPSIAVPVNIDRNDNTTPDNRSRP